MSAFGTAANVASICGGIVLPLGGLGIWFARRWVHEQIVIKLSNDDTPVAKYAHDARDNAKEARDFAEKALTAVMDTNKILIDHVTHQGIHRVPE